MNQIIHSLCLGADVTLNIPHPAHRKGVKVHLDKNSKLPIVETETRNGIPYLTCLSSYGLLLIGNCDPHTILTVDAPSDLPLEKFIVEDAFIVQRGERSNIADEDAE